MSYSARYGLLTTPVRSPVEIRAVHPTRAWFRAPGLQAWTDRGTLRMGASPFGPYGTLDALALSVPEAAALVEPAYRAVLHRDPSTEELQTAAAAIAAGLLSPAQLRDALKGWPAIDWRYVLYGGGGLVAFLFLTALLRR